MYLRHSLIEYVKIVKQMENEKEKINNGEPVPQKPKPIITTYATDIAEILKEQQGSVLKVAMAENERKLNADSSIGSNRGKRLAAFGVIFVVIAILAIVGISYLKPSNTTVPVDTTSAPQIISIVKAEGHTPYDVTNKTPQVIIPQIRTLVEDTRTVKGTIEDVYPYFSDEAGKHLVKADDFLLALGASVPPELSRVLKKPLMLGIHKHNDESPNTLFVILKTETYPSGFAGMLIWENVLFDNMHELFGINAEGDNSYLFAQKWNDVTIKNKDSRAILDQNGVPILFYTFLDDTTTDEATLIITANQDTLSEIIGRFFANTLVR